VRYAPISLTMAANQGGSEGTASTFNLGSFGGGGGTYSVTVNWGDGTTSTQATQPGAMTSTHTYVNDRSTPYTVSVTVSDSSGNTASGTFTIAVANQPPAVKLNTPGPGSNLAQRTSYAFKATFSDPGTADTHTCTIAWGDGTTSTGTVGESGGAGTCTSSHSWFSTGNYTITVTVRDNAGATATATSAITVTKTGGTVFTVLSVKLTKHKTTTKKATKHSAKTRKSGRGSRG
jgi:hypothetical protein